MKLELEFSKEMLNKLKDLYKDIDNYPFLVLTEGEEKIIKALLTELFTKLEAKEKYEKAKEANKEEICKCGHTADYHSLLGDRLCTTCDCACQEFQKRPMAEA